MMNANRLSNAHSLYDQVSQITREYFGPVTDRFLSRQITSHLDKPADQLLPEDLPVLLTWTKLTLAHVTEDTDIIDDYVRKMTALIDSLKK
jgi:hypothetical protein